MFLQEWFRNRATRTDENETVQWQQLQYVSGTYRAESTTTPFAPVPPARSMGARTTTSSPSHYAAVPPGIQSLLVSQQRPEQFSRQFLSSRPAQTGNPDTRQSGSECDFNHFSTTGRAPTGVPSYPHIAQAAPTPDRDQSSLSDLFESEDPDLSALLKLEPWILMVPPTGRPVQRITGAELESSFIQESQSTYE